MPSRNVLYYGDNYGDNLDVLRTRIKDESVDLIYLDPSKGKHRWPMAHNGRSRP